MTIKGDYILFFGSDWPSNFAQSPITVYDDFWEPSLVESDNEQSWNNLITFKTAEAYYQSRKAVLAGDKYSYYKIALAKDPAETKKLSRLIKLDSKAWDRIRVKAMWDTLHLKFEQNPDLKEKLLDPSLDGKMFVEASPYDCFWGAGIGEKILARDIETKGYIEWFNFVRDVPYALNMLGELLGKLRIELKSSI